MQTRQPFGSKNATGRKGTGLYPRFHAAPSGKVRPTFGVTGHSEGDAGGWMQAAVAVARGRADSGTAGNHPDSEHVYMDIIISTLIGI